MSSTPKASKSPKRSASSDTGQGAAQLTVSKPELLVDGGDTVFRGMIHDLLAIAARLESTRAYLGEFIGLSGIQYTILIAANHLGDARGETGGGTGVKEIAEHLGLSSSFVTIETGKLIKLGYLQKRSNPEDKRRVLLSLTDQARERLAELTPLLREINDTIFESFGEGDVIEAAKTARAVRHGCDNALTLAAYLFARPSGA